MARENKPVIKRGRQAKPSRDISPINRRPRMLFYISLFTAVVISIIAYFKDGGFRNVFKIDESIITEKENLKRIKMENEILRKRIKTAHNDNYQVEKFARERLNLVKKGETIFRFHEESEEGF